MLFVPKSCSDHFLEVLPISPFSGAAGPFTFAIVLPGPLILSLAESVFLLVFSVMLSFSVAL